MKISLLIKQLAALREIQGDYECVVQDGLDLSDLAPVTEVLANMGARQVEIKS